MDSDEYQFKIRSELLTAKMKEIDEQKSNVDSEDELIMLFSSKTDNFDDSSQQNQESVYRSSVGSIMKISNVDCLINDQNNQSKRIYDESEDVFSARSTLFSSSRENNEELRNQEFIDSDQEVIRMRNLFRSSSDSKLYLFNMNTSKSVAQFQNQFPLPYNNSWSKDTIKKERGANNVKPFSVCRKQIRLRAEQRFERKSKKEMDSASSSLDNISQESKEEEHYELVFHQSPSRKAIIVGQYANYISNDECNIEEVYEPDSIKEIRLSLQEISGTSNESVSWEEPTNSIKNISYLSEMKLLKKQSNYANIESEISDEISTNQLPKNESAMNFYNGDENKDSNSLSAVKKIGIIYSSVEDEESPKLSFLNNFLKELDRQREFESLSQEKSISLNTSSNLYLSSKEKENSRNMNEFNLIFENENGSKNESWLYEMKDAKMIDNAISDNSRSEKYKVNYEDYDELRAERINMKTRSLRIPSPLKSYFLENFSTNTSNTTADCSNDLPKLDKSMAERLYNVLINFDEVFDNEIMQIVLNEDKISNSVIDNAEPIMKTFKNEENLKKVDSTNFANHIPICATNVNEEYQPRVTRSQKKETNVDVLFDSRSDLKEKKEKILEDNRNEGIQFFDNKESKLSFGKLCGHDRYKTVQLRQPNHRIQSENIWPIRMNFTDNVYPRTPLYRHGFVTNLSLLRKENFGRREQLINILRIIIRERNKLLERICKIQNSREYELFSDETLRNYKKLLNTLIECKMRLEMRINELFSQITNFKLSSAIKQYHLYSHHSNRFKRRSESVISTRWGNLRSSNWRHHKNNIFSYS